MRISKEEIDKLPLGAFDRPPVLVNNQQILAEVVPELLKEPLLGFDIESPPVFQKNCYKPPALLQLATAEKAWLFQFKRLTQFGELFSILENPNILKVGVAVDRDICDLQHIKPFKAAGFVDLAPLANARGIENNGLRGLAAACLGFRISKACQRSNWGVWDLSAQQQRYAATDAWCGYKIYRYLLEMPQQIIPSSNS